MDIQYILMTFNRPEHTQKVLEGMKAEEINCFTIYLDAPVSEEDRQQQKDLNQLFSTIDWADVQVIRRPQPLGLARSIVKGISETLQTHDSVVVLEDDCFPERGLKDFMELSLRTFQQEKKVRSICGYTYPCFAPSCIKQDFFFLERFCPWGWATWRDRWEDFNLDLRTMAAEARKLSQPLARIGRDIETYCQDEQFLNHQLEIWSLNWILCHFLTETLSLYPKFSLINNIGFDGSGVHSQPTDVFTYSQAQEKQTLSLSCIDELTIAVNHQIQDKIVYFLEQHSKMTMVLNGNKKKAQEQVLVKRGVAFGG